MTTTAPRTREQIENKYKWNAESVFPTRADWQTALASFLDDLPKLDPFKGRLGESPTVLADYFELLEGLNLRIRKLYMYAVFSSSVDSGDTEAQSMVGQVGAAYGKFSATAAFTNPELIAIGQTVLMAWTKSEPRLAIYAHSFDDLFRQQAHVRSADVEEILGMASEPFGSIEETFSLLTNADIKFTPARDSDGTTYEVTQGTWRGYVESPDRELRRTTWESYADGYLAFKNTLAANLMTQIRADVFNMRARLYNSSLEAALTPNNIPTDVFYALIDTFKKNLSTWHKYWAIKRRVLGVDTFTPYDVWAPIVRDEPHIPYEQAVDWISAGLQPLGDEYVNTLRRGCLEDRWVDVYPNVGKRQGAFSYGSPGTHPFIMMSYQNNLNAMSTLAHELGHSMHSYLTWQNQPTTYSDYTLFVAEVASNFNQAMVRAHLFKTNSDPQFQMAVINEAMYNFHRYFFQMPTLARFELEIHERAEQGRGVTADDMIALMADLLAEGYGSEVTADRERSGITWAQFGHLYANFYVYQYATGIAAAHALANNILAGENGAADRYLSFLKAGSSKYPIDALKLAGVDMISPEPVEKAFATLADYVDRLDRLTR